LVLGIALSIFQGGSFRVGAGRDPNPPLGVALVPLVDTVVEEAAA
jgi:hypothetical protein